LNNKLSLAIIALLLITMSAMIPRITLAEKTTITIAVDLAHGESDKYLNYIQGNITEVTVAGKTYQIKWLNITTPITSEILSGVDILLIGQPRVGFTVDEMDAIVNWLKSGNKALYVAGDSDYNPGQTTIDVVNKFLEYIGSKLRLEQGAVYSEVGRTYTYEGVEYPTVAAAYYRMLAFVEPDPSPLLHTEILAEGISKPILMHGPTCIIWVDDQGNYRDPVTDTYPGLIRIAWFRNSYIGVNYKEWLPLVYDPLFYGLGAPLDNSSFVAYAAEYWPSLNVVITVAGESLYGDYEPAWASYYYGVDLDGPLFVTNLVKWWINIITTQRTEVLAFEDPLDDDNGAGTLKYPTNTVFIPGVFDLVKFQVFVDDQNIYFRATFRDLGGNPWVGPNGWSLQLLQIYVLTTLRLMPNTTAPGLNVEIYPGWHYLITATPGWGDTPWPDGEVSALYAHDGSLVAKEGDKFDAYAIPELNAIEVRVDKSLMRDVENIADWVFVVAVASYDGYGDYKVRAVQAGDPAEWVLGGGDPLAILNGVQPHVVDLLAPTTEDQYVMLKSYNIDKKELATVFGLSRMGLVKPAETPTVTVTLTTTLINNVTVHHTTTLVQTSTQTTTSTTTVTVPDMTTSIIVGIIALVIGLAVGYMLKKK
jgi:Membrane-anchored protein predicted to be involved in regulation of amylopullulanase